MKTCTAILLALGIAMSASAQDIDRFRYFQEHGVMDPQISAEAANSLVREGIASESPEIIDSTIRGLGNLAPVLAHDLPHAYGKLPTRTFQTVPGLKQFLIEHWRRQHANVGGSTSEALRNSLGFHSYDGIMVASPSPAEWGLEATDAGEPVDPGDFLNELSRRVPPWLMIPQILSVYWPGDSEVEQFLYDMKDTDRASNAALTTLDLLNTGKFTSEAANGFRISQLENPDTEVGASATVIRAAEGLALSRPAAALPALIEAGAKNPAARSAILVAVAGYDENQLELYARQIGQLVQHGIDVIPTTAESEAYDRLIRLVMPVVE